MEYWGNDLAGTKAVLITRGCTAEKAEAALGSYLCQRSESRVAAERRQTASPSSLRMTQKWFIKKLDSVYVPQYT
jgi:hypothetical protein